MLGVLLALSGSLMWGFADYLGGLQTRSHKVLSVVVISQTAGLIVISAVVALRGVALARASRRCSLRRGGGALASVCIVIFYLALSYGPISIVAPVLASSASIPVIYGLARGERPSPVQLAGIVATLAGVVLVSWTHADGHARGRRGIGFGVLAALLLGTIMVLFSRASVVDPYWASFVLRVTSISMIGRLHPRAAQRAAGGSPRASRSSPASACSTCWRTSPTRSRRRCSCSRSPPC